MQLTILLFGALLAAELFFIALDFLRFPSLAAEKAMLAAAKRTGAKPKNNLSAAWLTMTPELLTASAIVKAAAVTLGVIPSRQICDTALLLYLLPD